MSPVLPSRTRRSFLATSAAMGLTSVVPVATGAATAIDRELDSLARADTWLNSPPLTSTALLGKVVLVDFWTYTCINWLRTLPYIRAWAEKYNKYGLVVIGVHAPEFAFEKDLNNCAEP
jgi:thiol-disulfide isomerase/thioredoxin